MLAASMHRISYWPLSCRRLSAIVAIMGLSGCAAVVNTTYQVVAVDTVYLNGKVGGVRCKLHNDKGVYQVTTPGTVAVRRDYGDLIAVCEKEGLPSGIASFSSQTGGAVAGNVLVGGLLGVGVDTASGAAYDYPAVLRVMMGETNIGPIAGAGPSLNGLASAAAACNPHAGQQNAFPVPKVCNPGL